MADSGICGSCGMNTGIKPCAQCSMPLCENCSPNHVHEAPVVPTVSEETTQADIAQGIAEANERLKAAERTSGIRRVQPNPQSERPATGVGSDEFPVAGQDEQVTITEDAPPSEAASRPPRPREDRPFP